MNKDGNPPDGFEEDNAEDSVANNEVEKVANVVNMSPVHAAPGNLKVQRRVGRPRKVERMASTSDLEYHSAMTEEKAKFIEADPVVAAAKYHADTSDMLRLIKIEVAKEAAAMHFQRIENEKLGRDTQQTSSRRIDALTKVSSIELEIKKLGAHFVDLKSEKMQRVFQFFVEKVKDVAADSLAPEQVDLLFNRLSTALEGWEDKCADLVSNEK